MRMNNWRDGRRSRPPSGKTINFMPLNTPLDKVLMQIKDKVTLTWLDNLKGDLNKRPRNKYCYFHRYHGHDTSECYGLKQQIKALIKQGKLQRFARGGENPPRDLEPNQRVELKLRALLREIRVIVGGSTLAGSSKKAKKTYLWMVQSVQISGQQSKMTRVDNPTINFMEEDA